MKLFSFSSYFEGIEVHLIYLAPAPLLARLERFDDGVTALVEVLGGVLVLRVVAAAHVPTGHTEAKVYPCIPHLQAVFAAVRAGPNVSYLVKVGALRVHNVLLN